MKGLSKKHNHCDVTENTYVCLAVGLALGDPSKGGGPSLCLPVASGEPEGHAELP